MRKHARATDVEIALTSSRGRLRLTVADNGAGFNPRARTPGFGVIGMRERADALGGRLTVARRERGTLVTLVFALGGTSAMPKVPKLPKVPKVGG